MGLRRLDNVTKPRSCDAQTTVENQAAQELPAHQHARSLASVGPNGRPSVAVHSVQLQRLTATRSPSIAQAARQLQRAYGNHYMEKVVALSRQDGRRVLAPAAPSTTVQCLRIPARPRTYDQEIDTSQMADFKKLLDRLDRNSPRLIHIYSYLVDQQYRDRYTPGEPGPSQVELQVLLDVMEQKNKIPYTDDGKGTDVPWGSADYAEPTAEGVTGGVLFVGFGNTKYVVKPVQGSPAGMLFGEKVLSNIGGVQATESRAIPNDNRGEGRAILQRIERAMIEAKENNRSSRAWKNKYGSEITLLQRWNEIYPIYKNANYFLIQKFLSGKSLSKVLREGGIFDNTVILQGLGKVLVLDALIGNADRFVSINLGNALVLDSGQLGLIDTEAILQNIDKITSEFSEDVTKVLIEGNAESIKFIPERGTRFPAAGINEVTYDFNKWFEKRLKYEIERRFKQENLPVLSQDRWNFVKFEVYKGFRQGLEQVKEHLYGSKYSSLIKSISDLESKYGKSDDFDKRAFEIKSAHLRAFIEGQQKASADYTAKEYEKVLKGDKNG